MNETEAAMLSGRAIDDFNNLTVWQDAATDFIQQGVKNVVITLGAKSAYDATHKGDKGVVDSEKTFKVMNTTGAGYVAFAFDFLIPHQPRIASFFALSMPCNSER
jgi:ribokinase